MSRVTDASSIHIKITFTASQSEVLTGGGCGGGGGGGGSARGPVRYPEVSNRPIEDGPPEGGESEGHCECP